MLSSKQNGKQESTHKCLELNEGTKERYLIFDVILSSRRHCIASVKASVNRSFFMNHFSLRLGSPLGCGFLSKEQTSDVITQREFLHPLKLLCRHFPVNKNNKKKRSIYSVMYNR